MQKLFESLLELTNMHARALYYGYGRVSRTDSEEATILRDQVGGIAIPGVKEDSGRAWCI